MRVHSVAPRLFWSGLVLAASLALFGPPFAVPASAQDGAIRFENISTEEGLSQGTVNAIFQDRQGFMWFGTEEGLNQYDGYQFTVYRHDLDDPRSLSNSLVWACYEDRDGALWVGTNSGLDRLDRSTGTFDHYPTNQPGSAGFGGAAVTAIDQDASGSLWVGTNGGGLYALDLSSGQMTGYRHRPNQPESLANDIVNVIHVSPTGELWIGTDGGLDRFDSTTGSFAHSLQASTGSPVAGDVQVRAITEDGQGLMWIGTQIGLLQWDRATNRFGLYRHDPNDPASLSDDAVLDIYQDSLGTLWIGTLRGLSQFDKTRNGFIRYAHDPNNPSSLSSDYIRTIFEDRSGVLWMGTSNGGLNKYARSTQKFALYGYHPGFADNLSDNNIWSVYKDRSGSLWIGTFFSGLNKLDPATGKVTIYQRDPANPASLSDNEIRAILQDRNGTLWIGTEHGGLNRFDPATASFVHYQHQAGDPNSLSTDRVFALYEDHLGRLWIGTEGGGLNRFDPATGGFVHIQHDAGDPTSLSDDSVRAIIQDHTGALWIGTEHGGLNRWDSQGNHLGIFRHDPANPASLSNDWIGSILEDKNGTIWIGTVGGGLNRYDSNTPSFTHYTVKDGLSDDAIFGILADPDGNLWLSTTRGISRFNPATGLFRNYDISDGLQGYQFNPGAFFQDQNGEMYFGGSKGLNAFYPRQVRDNPIPPPVVITAFSKSNQRVRTDLASNEAVQLSYRDNLISLEFAALDYNAPAKNQYAYQLAGVDKDWVMAGTRNYASYTNLAGGDYVFRVKASNNDGVWSTAETTLRIHVTPPFWETWWFIGLVGLTVVAGSAGGYWLRVRDMQARTRELEKRVARRTHELGVLNTIATVVNRSLDLTDILNAALEETMAVMRMDGGLAYRVEEPQSGSSEGPLLSLLAHRGVSEDYLRVVRSLPLGKTMVGSAAGAGKPAAHDALRHPNPQIREANEREGIRLGVSMPLVVKGNVVGAVSLGAHEMRDITPEELSLLAAIGQQVGMAVVNARLYEQAEETAVSTERGRLARELHDSVTQLLYSVTLYAEAAAELLDGGDRETASGHLRDLRDTAQEALREMRLLIFELRQPALEHGGLAAALQARLDAVETRGGMHVELQVQGSDQLARPVQAELYNIAQEALNNALKHARANRVRVRLLFGEAATEMEIADDGAGFDPALAQTGGGYGFSGMQERSQKVGGTLEIDSAPGRGTRVKVTVPVTSRERSNRAAAGSAQTERE